MRFRSRWRTKATAIAGLALVATAVLVWATGASGGSTPAAKQGKLAGAAAPISQAQAIIKKWEKPAKFVPSGPPFNARKAAKGKTIGWVSVTTNIPFTQQMLQGARAGAKLAGFKIEVCDGKGQPSEWARCYQRFIGEKVDLIMSQSIDPRILKTSIKAANKAHIPVMTSSSNYSEAKTTWPGTVAEDSQPFRLVSRLMGDYAITNSGGKVDALIITSNEVYVAPGQVKAIEGEFQKYCPSTCKAKVENVAIADWQSRVPTVVQSAITADPNLNYVIPLYDGAVPFAISAVHAKAAQSHVKVISFNASPGVMDFMKNKDVLVGDVGVWIIQHGWAVIDQAARVLAGQRNIPALRDPKPATRMFDLANAGSLNFSNPDSWYGTPSIAAFYKKQWMIH